MSLPGDTVLPELDETLRRRLHDPAPHGRQSDDGFVATMLLTARYGSPALLPDVLRLDLAQGRLGVSMQAATLRLWVRCDPAAGLQALRRALSWRDPMGRPTRVYSGMCWRNRGAMRHYPS